MFFDPGLRGKCLPEKTVCLTFDDGPGSTSTNGPGPRTIELARFLAAEMIPATFFVIGQFAANQLEIVRRVAGMGHLIGNHTFNHPALKKTSGAFAAGEIAETERLIAEFQGPIRLFRAPYGSWDEQVAGQLNWTGSRHYVGHIDGDIDSRDYEFWLNNQSAEECAEACLKKIRSDRKGIILMHDSSWEEERRLRSYTFHAAQIIVKALKAEGFSFIRLDEVPEIREAARITSVVALQAPSGHFVSPQKNGGAQVLVNGRSVGEREPLGVVELGNDNIALRCLSGLYLSPQNGGGSVVLANGPTIDTWEVLTRVRKGDGEIAIRCPSGHYLSPHNGGGGELLANQRDVTDHNVFRVVLPD